MNVDSRNGSEATARLFYALETILEQIIDAAQLDGSRGARLMSYLVVQRCTHNMLPVDTPSQEESMR
jgi:hypothetical protein